MKKLHFLFTPLFSFLKLPTHTAQAAQEECACSFASRNEENCFLYGPDPSSSTGGVVAYPKASRHCLEAVGAVSSNAQDYYLPVDTFWNLCPYANHTDTSVEAFIDGLLREFPQSEPAQWVMSNFVENLQFAIFEQDDTTGLWRLSNKIANSLVGIETDCRMHEEQCWNEVRLVMNNLRETRFNVMCQGMHQQQIPALYREQGRARRLLCQGDYTRNPEPQAGCNICGCDNCTYADPLGVVSFLYNGRLEKRPCAQLQQEAQNPTIYNFTYCRDVIWRRAYEACYCYHTGFPDYLLLDIPGKEHLAIQCAAMNI